MRVTERFREIIRRKTGNVTQTNSADSRELQRDPLAGFQREWSAFVQQTEVAPLVEQIGSLTTTLTGLQDDSVIRSQRAEVLHLAREVSIAEARMNQSKSLYKGTSFQGQPTSYTVKEFNRTRQEKADAEAQLRRTASQRGRQITGTQKQLREVQGQYDVRVRGWLIEGGEPRVVDYLDREFGTNTESAIQYVRELLAADREHHLNLGEIQRLYLERRIIRGGPTELNLPEYEKPQAEVEGYRASPVLLERTREVDVPSHKRQKNHSATELSETSANGTTSPETKKIKRKVILEVTDEPIDYETLSSEEFETLVEKSGTPLSVDTILTMVDYFASAEDPIEVYHRYPHTVNGKGISTPYAGYHIFKTAGGDRRGRIVFKYKGNEVRVRFADYYSIYSGKRVKFN